MNGGSIGDHQQGILEMVIVESEDSPGSTTTYHSRRRGSSSDTTKTFHRPSNRRSPPMNPFLEIDLIPSLFFRVELALHLILASTFVSLSKAPQSRSTLQVSYLRSTFSPFYSISKSLVSRLQLSGLERSLHNRSSFTFVLVSSSRCFDLDNLDFPQLSSRNQSSCFLRTSWTYRISLNTKYSLDVHLDSNIHSC